MASSCFHIDTLCVVFLCDPSAFQRKTGAVEIDIGMQVLLIEVIDERCPMLRDMGVTEQFSNHSTICTFSQGIVIGLA